MLIPDHKWRLEILPRKESLWKEIDSMERTRVKEKLNTDSDEVLEIGKCATESWRNLEGAGEREGGRQTLLVGEKGASITGIAGKIQIEKEDKCRKPSLKTNNINEGAGWIQVHFKITLFLWPQSQHIAMFWDPHWRYPFSTEVPKPTVATSSPNVPPWTKESLASLKKRVLESSTIPTVTTPFPIYRSDGTWAPECLYGHGLLQVHDHCYYQPALNLDSTTRAYQDLGPDSCKSVRRSYESLKKSYNSLEKSYDSLKKDLEEWEQYFNSSGNCEWALRVLRVWTRWVLYVSWCMNALKHSKI